MSKVRREKHKILVWNEILGTHLHRIHFYNRVPRLRQLTKANIEYLIREFKNE